MSNLSVITNATEIRRAMRQFRAQLKAAAEKKQSHRIGYPGGSGDGDIYVLPRHGIWLCLSGDHENRYWNAFGHIMPEERGTLPLDVEINVPSAGVNRNIGAVFVHDPAGRVYIAHRGRIGGGAEGVGAGAFWDRCDDQAVQVFDADRVSKVIVLGALGDKRLAAGIAAFVKTVADVKAEVKAAKEAANVAPRRTQRAVFTPEFEGRATVRRNVTEAVWQHGVVVRHLEAAMRAAEYTTSNDKSRDLVARRRGVELVFEVKTEATTQSVYTGVGQLVFGAPKRGTRQRAVLVLPDSLAPGLPRRLAGECIEVLTYAWEGDAVVFPGLRRLLATP